MKYLALIFLAGCATVPTDPVVVDVGNFSLKCIYQGQVLRYIAIEDDYITKYLCVDPPGKPSKDS